LVALGVGTGEIVMRYFMGLVCVLALGVVGCGETSGGTATCVDNVCPCSEAGIRAAIAEGSGPFTFDCNGPTTVVTKAEVVIDNDVILDGEGNLTLDGNDEHSVLSVPSGVTVDLRGFMVTKGGSFLGGGIVNNGTLTLTDSVVSENSIGIRSRGGTVTLTDSTVSGNTINGIWNSDGTVTLTDSVVSENSIGIWSRRRTVTLTDSTVSENGIGIVNEDGTVTLANSTVSGNADAGIVNGILNFDGTLTLTNSTVSGNAGPGIWNSDGTVTLANTLVDDDCFGLDEAVSGGYNIESPGDTCGFDQGTDKFEVSADDLKLGPLQDNGGPTMTHALGAGSVAIDQIPAVDCVDAEGEPLTTDQRGEPRDSMCDVGAFEVQP
jgi:hypothetical protein